MEEILDKIRIIAKKEGVKAYAVGGPVRDILLGNKDFGIDITVEGDGIEFGRILQKEFGGKLHTHQKFGTASLIISGVVNKSRILRDCLIDVASCREEKYPEPAKLPKVGAHRNVPLQEDLKRRDFTINAMAMDLETKELIDPFGGKKDLDKGLIRILHPKSFVDDPTRIFRALRFAGRFGFQLESQTELLAERAIKEGLLKKLTPKRIRNEIILILKEPNCHKILELMSKFGILNILGLRLPSSEVFKNIDKNLKVFGFPSGSSPWFAYLLGTIVGATPDKSGVVPTIAKALCFTRKELQKIERVRRTLSYISKLECAKKPSEVYKLLKGMENEELLVIASAYPKLRHQILKFLGVYKKVKLKIRGNDLIKLGIKEGPLYKELLSATLYAKLDGKVRTKKEELEFVKSRMSSL